jgi:hypothetical protein
VCVCVHKLTHTHYRGLTTQERYGALRRRDCSTLTLCSLMMAILTRLCPRNMSKVDLFYNYYCYCYCYCYDHYIHTYIHTYIYTYIHMYMHRKWVSNCTHTFASRTCVQCTKYALDTVYVARACERRRARGPERVGHLGRAWIRCAWITGRAAADVKNSRSWHR